MNDHPFTVRARFPIPGNRCDGTQVRHGKVIQRMPVYDMTRSARTQNGAISRLLGFDVVYEVDGEQYRTRVARNPGNRIAVDVGTLSQTAAPMVA